MRLLLVLLFCLAPMSLAAACNGSDLARTLSPEERQRLDDALSGQPFATGNHWRATRGTTVIHLVGTVHVQDDRLDGPMARLGPLIDDAAQLLVESPRDQQSALLDAMTADPDLLLLSEGTLIQMMGEPAWSALATALRDRGIPPFMAARMRPWYLSMLLSIPPCLDMETALDGGFDARIEARARAAGVPVSALEPFDTAIRVFDAVPQSDQVTLLRSAAIEVESAEDMLETLLAGYFRQEHAASWYRATILAERHAAQDLATIRAAHAVFEQRLLEDRNRAWIPVILDAARRSDGPVVAAFGAAHLSGPTGVPALLEARGFTLERLPF